MKLLSTWKNKAIALWPTQSLLQKVAHVLNAAGLGAALFIFFDSITLYDSQAPLVMSVVVVLAAFFIYFPLVVSPYWGLFTCIRDAIGYMQIAVLLFTGVVVSVLTYIYIDAFYIHLDAQNGLVMLFLPIYAWLFIFAFKVVSKGVQKMTEMLKKK